jgi:hypothetical protein
LHCNPIRFSSQDNLEFTKLPNLLSQYNINILDDAKFQSSPFAGHSFKTLQDNTPFGSLLLSTLTQHISTLAKFRFRIIRNAQVTDLLLNKDKDTVVGVHYEVSLDQKSKSEVNFSEISLKLPVRPLCRCSHTSNPSFHKTRTQVIPRKASYSPPSILTPDTKVNALFTTGSFLGSPPELPGNALLYTLLRSDEAAKSAAGYPGNRSSSGVVRQPDFYDSNGILHETGNAHR